MSYESLDPEGAKKRLDGGEGWIYLDVRTVEEFEQGHIPGAYNVPLAFRGPMGMEPNDAFVDEVGERFAKDAQLVVGCAVGGRSTRACELLDPEGFQHLVNMDGGFMGRRDEYGELVVPGWSERGYPVSTTAHEGRGYAHSGTGPKD